MKNRFLLAGILFIGLASCTQEQTPAGLNLVDEQNTTDTTYIATSIPTAQTKKVLFEEATGVHCANCPDGAKILHDLKTQFPDRIISASVYSPFLNQFQPPALYDFNSTDANDLVTFLGGDPAKPSSAIDRMPTGTGTFFFSKAVWATQLDIAKLKTTPLNIELTSTPTAASNEYIISSKITFTQATTAELAVSVYLVEDGVIDYQDSSSVEILNYEHNHILRKIITPISGAGFLTTLATKEQGRVFQKFNVFTLPTTVLNKSNCKIICFVHKTGSSKEVIHVEEIDL